MLVQKKANYDNFLHNNGYTTTLGYSWAPQVLEKGKPDLKQPYIALQICNSVMMSRILQGVFKHSAKLKGRFCRVLSAFNCIEAKVCQGAQRLLKPPHHTLRPTDFFRCKKAAGWVQPANLHWILCAGGRFMPQAGVVLQLATGTDSTHKPSNAGRGC